INGTAELCEEEATATFTATDAGAGANYTWNFGSDATPQTATGIGPHNVVYASDGTKTVSLQVELNNCTASDNFTVTVFDRPTVTVADVTVCSEEDATLTAAVSGGQAPYTYEWESSTSTLASATYPEITFNQSYSVTVTDANGCTAVATGNINVNPLPVPDASDDLTICEGESTTLFVEGVFFSTAEPFVYEWWEQSDPATIISTTDEVTVMPSQLGVTNYIVRVTDANGCKERDIVMVTVVPNPEVTVADVTICDGDVATLNAVASGGNGSFTYLWSNGETTPSIDVTPGVGDTDYSVTVTSTYTTSDGGVTNCTATTTATVTVNENPTVTITDTDDNNIVCPGEEVILTANISLGEGPYTIEWTINNDPAVISNDTEITVTPNVTTTYKVKVTDANGCMATDEVEIVVDPDACAQLGDFVFVDTNGDGVQDPGEPGVANVTVDLKDADGNVIATTTTDGNGNYAFADLVPGEYSVQFDLPTGFEFTDVNAGANEALDSDADPAMNGMTDPVTLSEGETNNDLDAGIYELGSIGDFVFLDTDGDGIQDPEDDGIPGVTVSLLDENGNVIETTTTDANGAYLFDDLPPGTYSVQFTTPSGLAPSPADQGGDDALDSDALAGGITAPIELSSGEDDLTIDAGFFGTASLGDFVFLDEDADGIQEAGEAGIEGVTVNLLVNGVQVATTTTNNAGFYQFINLIPGEPYVVEFIKPAGLEASPANQGGDDALDSDADEATGLSQVVILASSENNPTIDAGYYETASLGDFVFLDEDGDGIQDPGEAGIEGVTVNLKDENGTIISTTTTDVNGNYSFTDLVPGEYSVQFELPTGFEYTQVNAGSDEALDSDADPTMNGMTDPVTLSSGETNNDLDAGLYEPASLGDFVFLDQNADGIQDNGEPGIQNVTVNLLVNGTQVATTTTNGAGFYEFTDLVPGVEYVVEFVAPLGFEPSPADQSGDDTIDSDADETTGQSPIVVLESGENNPTIDAGFYELASLGDFVWLDTDGDGIQDNGEPGIEGVTVNLLDNNGNQIATTTTDATGFYEFTDLEPDTYQVEFVTPAGLTPSPADQGGDDALDSDALAGGVTAPITLSSGEDNPTIDAGYFETASLGDFVWLDTDADGIQDFGEPGIEGVTVNLLVNGTQVATTTTDATGFYQFTNLTPGEPYVVEFIAPAGFEPSPANQGGDDTIDSDADETS
ncbi:MAG: SdrD B-like domain-containing protein, partial [Bacteroidota bacterium]